MGPNDRDATLKRIRREPPTFRRVALRSTERLSAHMLRLVLGGDELNGFAIESPASSVRLLLPPPGHRKIVIPTWSGNQFDLPDGSRAPIRTFTPRAFDADRLELTIDLVLHEQGAATDWARTAQIGDETAISGPGRSEPLDESASSFLLAGDESAIPAISQLLEAIESDRSVDVHIEIRHADAELPLPSHPGATVCWHVAAGGAPPGDQIVAAVTGIADLPDVVWIAGEAAAVQKLRKYLFDEAGRSRSDVTARGYWKLGRSAT
jgi:NADPH-dependent ferric siderophore reductase